MRHSRVVIHHSRPISLGPGKLESVGRCDGEPVEFVLGPIQSDVVQPHDAAIVIAEEPQLAVLAQRDVMWLNVIVDHRVWVVGVGLMEMIGR